MTLAVVPEPASSDELDDLDSLWLSRRSFILAPRAAVDRRWLDAAVGAIPDEYATGHYGLLTSGSTGAPKLVIGRHERSEQLARVIHLAQDNEPATATVVALPLAYSFAFMNQWLWSRMLDRGFILTEGFRRPEALARALQSSDATMLCLVGAQVPMLGVFGDLTFPGVVRLHFAGGRFPQEQAGALRARFPNARLFNNYGCTEALPRLTVRAAEDASDGANVGRPLEGIRMRSTAGALEFQSEYSAVGVVENHVFRPIGEKEWLPTGDLGEILPDGNVLLHGRAGEVIKRYGEKTSAQALQAALSHLWDGGMAVYLDHDSSGEPGFVLVLEGNPSQERVRELLTALPRVLRRPHWPLRVERVAELPRSSNQKVDALRLTSLDDREILWRQRI